MDKLMRTEVGRVHAAKQQAFRARMQVLSATLVVLSMTFLMIDKDQELLGWDGLPLVLIVTSLVYINAVVWRRTKGAESAA